MALVVTMVSSPRDNFYRCMTLIVDNGNEAAWELLDYYLSNQGTTLKDFIENNQHEIYHLCYNYGGCCRCQYGTVNKPKSRILYQSQLDILLDTKGSNIPCSVHVRSKPTCSHTINDNYANPNIATKQLDLTLCRCLLINFTNILPQGSVERNAFEDLINMRNKCCHAARGEISSTDYQTYKAQIEQCLLALAQVYGKTHDMQLKIKDAEKRPLDESLCKHLQQTILQEQVLQGVSGLHKHIESSQKAEERTTIEIQKLGKSTKRTLRAANFSQKSAGQTASKIQKLEESSKRTLIVVKSSKKSVDHTASKVQKLEENTEKKLQAVENTAANIEKKIEESSERTIQAVESSQKSVEHSSANIEKKLDESSERSIQAVESSQENIVIKIQKLDERMSKCETSKRSRLLGLTQTEIDGHLKEGTFVETPAVLACIKLLEMNSLLVLTGAAGTGKSRNSLEILHQFRIKHPEYETVKLTDLHDFTDVVTTEEKLVILFEDIFGRTNTRFAENTDVQIIDRLHACTIKGNLKTILTVRDTIRLSCDWLFTSHKIFHSKCEVDLNSKTFKITMTEKESLLSKYFFANNFRLLEFNEPENYFEEQVLDRKVTATVNRVTLHCIVETEPLLGFPEACSLFTGNRKLTRLGLSFFKHPSKYLYEEIEKLRINGSDNHQDRMSYVTLVYIFLNEDSIDPEDIDGEKCSEIIESCYGVSYKKIPACQIIDAANGMLGRYLIYHSDNSTYHFQHQTIFESVLISYSRIDTGLILSRLSFDFIREMVRLQNYKVREGEIVMKISPRYYSMLAKRVTEIIQSEYFNKSLSLNCQLLCESEIIRQNDELFIKSLIEKTHDAYFQQNYELQTFVTYNGECRPCKLYLPALLLERITLQNKMNESIILLLNHITHMLNSATEEDIEFFCKSSLLEAFLHVCQLENNEPILDKNWVPIKSLHMSEMTDYIRNSISSVCSRCPLTTMKWMLKNIDRSIFDMNSLLKRACEFKRLDVVQFLCETINHNQLDFTTAFVVALNNVWNDADELVSKWLIKNIDHHLFDMKQITSEVLEVGCMKDLMFLLKHINHVLLDMILVFTKLYKEGKHCIKNLFEWMGTNVEKKNLNTPEIVRMVCMVEDIEVVKYLFDNIDHSLLDVSSVLKSAVNSKWQGHKKELIEWLFLYVDLKHINMMYIINNAIEGGRYVELKILLRYAKAHLLNINTILRKACKNTNLELIKILLTVIDHQSLSIRYAVRSVCVLEKMELLEFFLKNVDYRLYDVNFVMKESCRYGWTHIVDYMLGNIEYSSLHIHTAIAIVLHREFDGPDYTWLRLLLHYPIYDKDGKVNKEIIFRWVSTNVIKKKLKPLEILILACKFEEVEVVKYLFDNIDHSLLDVSSVFMSAVHSQWHGKNKDLIEWLFVNVDLNQINMVHIINKAFERGKDVELKILLKNIKDNISNINTVMQNACKNTQLKILKILLSVVDHQKLNLIDAVKSVCVIEKIELLKFFLNKVDHRLYDVNYVMKESCKFGWINIVTWLLDNVEYSSLNVQSATNVVLYRDFEGPDKTLLKLLLNYPIHDKVDAAKIIQECCWWDMLDLVKWIWVKVDHKRLDIKAAMITACSRNHFEIVNWMLLNVNNNLFDIPYALNTAMNADKDDLNISLIQLLLGKTDHNLIDMAALLQLGCEQCWYDVVEWVFGNANPSVLDIEKAMNKVYIQWKYNGNIEDFYKDKTIDYRRRNTEPLVKLILEKGNHNPIDLRKVLIQGCRYGSLDVVTLVLKNSDHYKLNIEETVHILFIECDRVFKEHSNEINDDNRKKRNKYEDLIKFYIRNVNDNLFYTGDLLNRTHHHVWIDVVICISETKGHTMSDVIKAVDVVYDSWVHRYIDEHKESIDKRSRFELLLTLILDKLNHDSLDMKKILNHACEYWCVDLIKWLLKNIDKTQFDLNGAVNVLFAKYDSMHLHEDTRDELSSINKIFLDKKNHDLLDMKLFFELSCWYGLLDVVTLVLENIDHALLNFYKAVSQAFLYSGYFVDEKEHLNDTWKSNKLIKLFLDKVNHNLLDIKSIFNSACHFGRLDVVTLVLVNTDHALLDLAEAMDTVFSSWFFEKEQRVFNYTRKIYLDVTTLEVKRTDHTMLSITKAMQIINSWINKDTYNDKQKINNGRVKYELLIKLILAKTNIYPVDLKEEFNQACRWGSVDVVKLVLESIDHKRLKINGTLNKVYNDKIYIDSGDRYQPLVKLMLEKVNHDLLDLKELMKNAFRNSHLDVVTFLLHNTNHKKLNIMEAVNIANMSIMDADEEDNDINIRRDENEPLIKLILEKVNHDLLDLKELMKYAFRNSYLDVVTFLLQNTNYKKLNIMEAVNIANMSIMDADEEDDDINIRRDGNEPLIKLILEKVNHDFLDLKEIMYKACCYGYLDVVTFLLENTDHEKLHVMEAVNKACNQSIDEETDDNSCNEKLIKKILQKVKTDILDMEVLMNEACRNGWLDIVRWLVENIDHAMFDVDTAINVFIHHDSDETFDIFVLILENISPNLLNIGTVIEHTSRLNHTEKVLWLLQNKDRSLFEMKYVMNEACRNSNLEIIKYVMENMDKDCFDVRTAMNKACRSSKLNSLEAVKWLLGNIPHNMLDLESAMNNACRYGIVAVVEWFWTTLDRKLFNVTTAWNNACYNCNETLLSYLINTMDEKMLDKSKAMLQACQNYAGDKVISLLFEQPNMNTPENCKIVLKEACVHSNRPIVEWLLENTDIQPSELKEMLIYTIKVTINKSNDEDISEHRSLVWFMLKHPKVKELERNDLSDVIEAVSSIGQLDMAQQLWNNTEQSMFNTRAIVNTACEYGKFEIVDWFLQNIELTNIDVQTVMVESCCYGWLKIVKLLLSKFERENFDMSSSMEEACSYGRYEIVEFLLKNIDSKLFDTKLVMEKACGYGWKDITLWLFDNIDNISIDLKSCMFEACAQGRHEIAELFFSKYGISYFDVNILIDKSCNNFGNAGVIKLLIENFDLKQSHLDIIIKSASKNGWTEIMSSILDRCKNDQKIMEEAMKNACINGETEIVSILLQKIDTSFLDLQTDMIISCQKGWEEIVSLLLERVEHSLFDFSVAMNEACRCGEADVVELLIQKVNRENFNFETAIVEACKSHLNENLVTILLKYINRSTSDIEAVSGKAYDYGWQRVSSRLKRMIYNDISK